MYTSQGKAIGHGWPLLFVSAIAVTMTVGFSSLIGRAQGTKIPPINPAPQPSPKARPTPTPRKSPTPTIDKTTAAVAPGGANFSHSFSGSQLSSDWKLMNADAQRWTMQPRQKSLLIQTQTGTLSDTKTLKNWLVLNRDLPADDFEIIVEASIQIQAIGNYVSIALVTDDQNYFSVSFQGYCCGARRGPYFNKVFQGKNTYFGGAVRGDGAATQPEHIFLKIEREGNQYSGFYAYEDQPTTVEQIQWAKMGTLPWINFHGKLVLTAANYQDAPEVAAEFYSVLIRKR